MKWETSHTAEDNHRSSGVYSCLTSHAHCIIMQDLIVQLNNDELYRSGPHLKDWLLSQ